MLKNKWNGEVPEYLYHATDADKLDLYLSDGIPAGSYWANEFVSEYYQEDYDGDGILLKIPLASLMGKTLAPDQNGIDEPITSCIGLTEPEIHELWIDGYTEAMGYETPEDHPKHKGLDNSWANSLKLIGSLRVDEVIKINKEISFEYI